MHAPHLPSESCSLRAKAHRERLPFLLALSAISGLTALVVSLFAITWFFPFSAGESFIVGNREAAGARSLPDPFTLRYLEERRFTVYDTARKIDATFYTAEAVLGEGVFLSSDGWGVFLLNAEAQNFARLLQTLDAWELLDEQGIFHPIEKVIQDPLTDLVYIKTSAEGFRVIGLGSWEDTLALEKAWQYADGAWSLETLAPNSTKERGEKDAWREHFGLSFVSNSGEAGALVLSDNGSLLGFVDGEGAFIPSWIISLQLSSLLGNGKIVYTAPGVSGYFVTFFNTPQQSGGGSGGAQQEAFYLTRVEGVKNKSTLLPGDAILKINGETVRREYFQKRMLEAGEHMTFTVLRAGEEIEVTAEKKIVLSS